MSATGGGGGGGGGGSGGGGGALSGVGRKHQGSFAYQSVTLASAPHSQAESIKNPPTNIQIDSDKFLSPATHQ